MQRFLIPIVLSLSFLTGLGLGRATEKAAPPTPPTQWVGADLCCCEISISPPPGMVYLTRSKWEQATGGNPDAYLVFHLDGPGQLWGGAWGGCYLANPMVWSGTNPPGPCVPDDQVDVFAVYDGLPPYDPCEGCCG